MEKGSLNTMAWDDKEAQGVVQIGGVRLPLLGTGRIYVCGITPYDTTHLGHAATFVWADMAARVLRLTGHRVEVCRNITDVDDHLLVQAKVEGVPWQSLATQQSYRFERDMDLLGIVASGVRAPQPRPCRRRHRPGGRAPGPRTGLRTQRIGLLPRRWGRRAVGLNREEATALAAERGGHPDDPNKDDPLDAALWVRSVGDEPAWPSPWGPGRPGWHAECTAMALTTFGATVDLHVGGADLAFPHHAYEAAQAEAFTGVRPFARSWMHVGTVIAGGQKMAKSTGNLVFVHDLLERCSAAAIRLLILSRPWHESWEFDETELERAERELEEIRVLETKAGGTSVAAEEVQRALLENLDLPRALAVAKEARGAVLHDLTRLLGLQHVERPPW